MTKVKWLGEGENGPQQTDAYGQTFKVGEAVDITDDRILDKARGNQYFEVAGDKSETVEDNPGLIPAPAVAAAEVKNAAFGTQEELDAHRDASIEAAERNDEIQRRGPGRPRGSRNAPKPAGSKRASKKAGARRGSHANPDAGRAPRGGQGPDGEPVPAT
jgi:hypothetical protein